MRILLANKFYYPRGGDCICTINLYELLKKRGHDVALFAMDHPDNMSTIWKKYFPSEIKFSLGLGILESFSRPFGTKEVKNKFIALLEEFKPDIVHLHNIHTHLSPIIAKIAKEYKIKVIWTLHDYKLLCPRYDCLRNGEIICEECFNNKKNILKYNCMKNSKIASLLAYEEAKKWTQKKLSNYTYKFICPSNFMKTKMIAGGFNEEQITTIPNFIDITKTHVEEYKKEEYYCYVGRISKEKGITTLIKAAAQLPFKLKIVGDGPLLRQFKKEINLPNIEFLGSKNWIEVKNVVSKAKFMVISSEWYENNPMSVIESLCLGTPVIGSDTGGIPELLKVHNLNMIYKMKDTEDLKDKINYMFQYTVQENEYRKLALHCKNIFNEEKYYNKIMEIYYEKHHK